VSITSTAPDADGIVVITIDAAPVNALGAEIRTALARALDVADADTTCRAIVLTGANGLFSAGADVKEFNTPRMVQEPTLRSLIAQLEQLTTPVIAAIEGTCLGGGLELALGCHYRVVHARASLGLPEVLLGLLPGAGGTQRLPRAIGVEPATDMILAGRTKSGAELHALAGQRLITALVPEGDDLLQSARLLARAVHAHRPLPRVRDWPATHAFPDAWFGFVRQQATARSARLPAAGACVTALDAAVRLPFDEALAVERAQFLQLMHGPESKALRHAFFAERAARRVAGVHANTEVRAITRVGVVGAGTMGTGIAMACLAAELPVILVERDEAALTRGLSTVRNALDPLVQRGKLSAATAKTRLDRLRGETDVQTLADVDLVIEAVFEDMTVKRSVFAELDAVVRPGAILATNTSTLDIDQIASATSRPADVVGLHFFSPAQVMKLLEVVRGTATAPDVLATAMAFARTLRKTAVIARNSDGFIGNRMFQQYTRQATFLLDAGCTPQQVDGAMERFGMAMGPFRVLDLAGNDIGWAVRKRRAVEHPDLVYSQAGDRLCEAGRFGQKVGAGWYDYLPGRRDPQPSATVQGLLASHRAAIARAPQSFTNDEIVERLVLALVNEGAALLDEGIAARASDIDVVYLLGYGFPSWRGGPMHYAEQIGLASIVRALRRLAAGPGPDPQSWLPSPLLARLAAFHGAFADLEHADG
jgi:3-hydroxyacyl-CoA dehydrogenase